MTFFGMELRRDNCEKTPTFIGAIKPNLFVFKIIYNKWIKPVLFRVVFNIVWVNYHIYATIKVSFCKIFFECVYLCGFMHIFIEI
jgi:hypothetical protein